MDTSEAPKPAFHPQAATPQRSLMLRLKLAAMRPVIRRLRGMTLGSRVAVIDGEGRFLLVRHTYSPGWIFPGGGVERGESCLSAAIREVQEEACIIAKGPMQLHGIFNNHHDFPGDHLAFYVLREFEQGHFTPNMEIAEVGFFHADKLPSHVSGGSQRRIAEIINGGTPSENW